MSRSGLPSRSRPPERRSRRAPGAAFAALAALALLALLATPALAAQGPTKLEGPSITPETGSPTTTIVVEITFRDVRDREPEYVRVVIGGVTREMSAITELEWRAGVRFRWAGTLPVGEHDVRFEAADWEKFVDTLDAGTITIALPPPPETPKPRPPEEEPGDDPGDDPGSEPGVAPGSEAPDPGTDDEYPYRVGPTEGDGWDRTWSTALVVGGSPGGDATPGSPDAPGAPAPGGPAGPSGNGTTDSNGSGGSDASGRSSGSGGGIAEFIDGLDAGPGALLAALLPGTDRGILPTLPVLIGSAGGAGLWLAFSLFGKRRRDETPAASDAALHAAAATGLGAFAGSALLPEGADPEALLPRWRRPSLLQARKVDPIREGLPERRALAFGTDRDASHERRLIRYATVRLLDRPDETLGFPVGELAAGDEVELAERSGLYWFVRCPDGRSGWLHRMTLGDPVASPAPPAVGDEAFAALLAARGLR